MPFISPLALLGLLFVPAVIAMYLLKLRRDRALIPSTLLWQKLVADVEANAPWQKLRKSLLLLVQLLLVIILTLLAARPFLERPAGLAGDIVLVIDTSASMLSKDVAPDRLGAAKQAALDALKDLPSGGKVSVIAAGRSAKVVANGTSDLGRVRQAIDSITAEASTGDLGDALRLASALAARSGDAEILVATDASLGVPLGFGVPTAPASPVPGGSANPSPGTSPGASPSAAPSAAPSGAPPSQAPVAGVLDAPVRVLQVGRDRSNQAIVALAVRTAPSGVTRSVFVSVANLDIEAADRRLELWGDGQLLEARDLPLQPQRRTDVSIDDVPLGVEVVEVRLVGTGTDPTIAPDDLSIDDRAWAIVPSDRLRRILLVSEGDPYLETALSYLPNTELYGVDPDQYGPQTKPELFDLIIFESFVPTTLPAKPILAIAPPRDSDLGDVGGLLKNPGIGHLDPDEPILRYVDLTTLHISEARSITLPDWARTIIPGPRGNPLLYTGVRSGLPAAVLAFEPRRSDLPLQVAFPVLIANLTGELLGGSSAPTDAVAPGSPVSLPVPDGATGIRVERPDGSIDELIAPGDDIRQVTFSRTDLVGVYTVTPILAPGASGSPGASASPSQAPSGSPTGSAAPTSPPADPTRPVRFAVDLFAIDESNIAPGSVDAIERLGSQAGPGTGGEVEERAPARDELWIPIVLAALAFLMFEWAVYERDTLARFRRSLAARLSTARSRSG